MAGMSAQTLKVLTVFLDRRSEQLFGLELVRETGLRNGTVYPILGRLTESGWLESSWEEAEAGSARPRRKLYRLTDAGAEGAARALRRGDDAPRDTRRTDGAATWLSSGAHPLYEQKPDEDELQSYRDFLDRG